MRRRSLWLIVGTSAGAVALAGCVAGLVLLLATDRFTGEAWSAAGPLPGAGLIALSLGVGGALAFHSLAAWRGRTSSRFAPSGVWWLWPAFIALLGLGWAISTARLAAAWLLPLVHVLTMALPPLILLGLAGQALRGTGGRWRDVVVNLAAGGFLGIGLSLAGEVVVLSALAVVGVVILMMTPDGMEQLVALSMSLQDASWLQDPTPVLESLLSPVAVFLLVVAFTILVPLIEEACKTLIAAVAGRGVRPHAGRALLWGIASGAGFALVENLFSGALGGSEGWAVGAVARLGPTAMHCFSGGLTGWGWGQFWTERRPVRLLGAYAIAVAVHALWNAVALGLAFLGIGTLFYEASGLTGTLAGLASLMLTGLLGLLSMLFLASLWLAGRRLARGVESGQTGLPGAVCDAVDGSLGRSSSLPEATRDEGSTGQDNQCDDQLLVPANPLTDERPTVPQQIARQGQQEAP